MAASLHKTSSRYGSEAAVISSFLAGSAFAEERHRWRESQTGNSKPPFDGHREFHQLQNQVASCHHDVLYIGNVLKPSSASFRLSTQPAAHRGVGRSGVPPSMDPKPTRGT